ASGRHPLRELVAVRIHGLIAACRKRADERGFARARHASQQNALHDAVLRYAPHALRTLHCASLPIPAHPCSSLLIPTHCAVEVAAGEQRRTTLTGCIWGLRWSIAWKDSALSQQRWRVEPLSPMMLVTYSIDREVRLSAASSCHRRQRRSLPE